MNRSKKSAARIRKLLVICSLMTVIIAASTYAWFIGMKTVNVSSFDVEIESTESLLLSLNGVDWEDTINISESTFDSSSYVGNTNKWAGEGLIPVSSIGSMDSGASRMMIYEKASLTATPGGYRLLASRVDNYSAPTADEPDGYVVFDLFIKNFSGAQYLETLNILDEEAIYLTTDSAVTVAESGVANTGIENSVRVAFAQIGRVKGTSTDAAKIAGLSCAPTVGTGVTGICRTNIWEPNETKHEANAISWYDASCLARTGADVTDEDSYSGVCETITDGTAYPTYAINDDILLADNVDIYDGTEYNGYTLSTKMGVVETFTDTEKLKVGTSRPALMMLAPNSITKVRIYIYIEGQDIDNYDFASIGKAISVNFGFTKERFEQGSYVREEEPLVYTSEDCFNFTAGTINYYYYYELENSSNPACPRDVIIPKTIDGIAVKSIGDMAFSQVELTSALIPDSVTNIGDSAFSYNQLKDVEIPNSVKIIKQNAFVGSEIENLTLSNSLTYIGDFAFSTNLLKTLVIPDTVTYIGDDAFSKNILTSVVLSDSLETIGVFAFWRNQLETLSIPNSVTSIGQNAFSRNNLTSVVLSDSLETIGDSAFYYNQLETLSIPNTVTSIGPNAFSDNNLTNVILSNSLEIIGSAAFYENNLISVIIPDSVSSIGDYAFAYNPITSVCIKGKSNSSEFGIFGSDLWYWADGYSDSNIIWNCTN